MCRSTLVKREDTLDIDQVCDNSNISNCEKGGKCARTRSINIINHAELQNAQCIDCRLWRNSRNYQILHKTVKEKRN